MCKYSFLFTGDDNSKGLQSAHGLLGNDKTVKMINKEGDQFVEEFFKKAKGFDFIFVDTQGVKYRFLEDAFRRLSPHGLYVIGNMLPKPNWPIDLYPKVKALLDHLDQRTDFDVTKMGWSSAGSAQRNFKDLNLVKFQPLLVKTGYFFKLRRFFI